MLLPGSAGLELLYFRRQGGGTLVREDSDRVGNESHTRPKTAPNPDNVSLKGV
jgi:hypothetical protein